MNAMEDLTEHHIERHEQCLLFDDKMALRKIRAIK
jgi:hypothetical protein